jgi:hypothetical protein
MAWAYEITNVQQNPVPYDVRFITVRFYIETQSFSRTFKLLAANFPNQAAIDAFLADKCIKLDNFDADVVAASNAPVNRIQNSQFRIWLIRRGNFTAINNAITNLGTTSELFQAWQNNNVFTRTSPIILAIAEQLSLTVNQINNMFEAAAAIEV